MSTNYGIIKNGLPAETQSGLRFLETFGSAAEVQKNGGTIEGTPTINNGFTQNSDTDYISIPETNLGTVHSLVLKIKLNNYGQAGLGCAYIGGAAGNYFLFGDSSRLYYQASGSSQSIEYVLPLNKEITVSIVRNNNSVKFYVNESLVGSIILSDNFDLIIDKIGRYTSATYTSDATYNSVRIFNTAISAGDIEAYSNNTIFNYDSDWVSKDKMTDGDMEDVDTSAYTDVRAVLSKDTETFYSGTQSMKITADDTEAGSSYARQTIGTAGKTYKITGRYKTDGFTGTCYFGTTVTAYLSLPSVTDWTYFEITIPKIDRDWVSFGIQTTALEGTACWFDDITVKEYSPGAELILPMRLSEHSPSHIDTTEKMTDGDMEDVDTSAYTFSAGDVLTKETSTLGGGTQCLRIAYGGAANPYAKQDCCEADKTYRITGYARSSGTVAPILANGSAGTLWTGTNSTDWQEFDITFLQPSAADSIFLRSNLSSAGYIEWNNMTVNEIIPKTLDVSGNNNHATFGDGSTTSTFPTKLSERRGYNLSGDNQYLFVDKAVMTNCYTNNALTVTALIKTEDLLNENYPSIFAVKNEGGTLKHLLVVKYDTAGNSGIISTVLNINGTRRDIQVSGKIIPEKVYQIISMSFDGTNRTVTLNGEQILNSALYDGALTDINADLRIGKEGSSAYYYNGDINSYVLHSKALSPIQTKDLHINLIQSINQK